MTVTYSSRRQLAWISIGILVSGTFFSFEVLARSISVRLDELVGRSDLVISGTVVRKESYREPSFLMDISSSDGKGNSITRVESSSKILTDFEILVSQVIRGHYDESTIYLTVMGGTVGGQSISYSHSLGLTTGKEYILFLGYEKRNDKWWVVSGRQAVIEEVVVGSGVFRTEHGERLTIEQFKSRIETETDE